MPRLGENPEQEALVLVSRALIWLYMNWEFEINISYFFLHNVDLFLFLINLLFF